MNLNIFFSQFVPPLAVRKVDFERELVRLVSIWKSCMKFSLRHNLNTLSEKYGHNFEKNVSNGLKNLAFFNEDFAHFFHRFLHIA